MTQTHICWVDWIEDYFLCVDCASNFGNQWTGTQGENYTDDRKLAIWEGAHKAAPSHKECERCGCELSGEVYRKTFNPYPCPETDSHLFDPEELTIPPIDFDQSTDEEIARWLISQPLHFFHVPQWEVLLLLSSIHWFIYAHDHPEETWDTTQDKDNLSAFCRKTSQFLEQEKPEIWRFFLNYQKRHDAIFQQVKEILDNAASEGT